MASVQTIVYPLPPTLNKIISSARRSIYASSSEKRKWTQELALMSSALQPYGENKVWLCFNWRVFNENRDPDNIAAAAKYIMDGLVAAGVLPDDSLRYIGSPVLHYYDKAEKWEDRCELTISTYPPVVTWHQFDSHSFN
ncbi:hypothetical protein [Okeania sp. SIO2B9]|uniref:hypothetical protein n=1 Tax=Okeania sp. SIO2B9 TaxID=2607782 RepID=UPI00142C934F|nr:hypothetical protein [Okeania sp. SIO2B9]NES89284.1 hypothetical protein [Okeania sp. SIO2B9]